MPDEPLDETPVEYESPAIVRLGSVDELTTQDENSVGGPA